MIIIHKQYDVGLLIGRFQVFHLGHKYLADMALTYCDRLLIFVGSAQEKGTERNPFSIETRIEKIKEIYLQDNVIVRGLPDLTNEDDITTDWGKYLLKNAYDAIGKFPDLMIYGNDESRSGWFDPEDIKNIFMLEVPRGLALPKLSATGNRKLMVEDLRDAWRERHPVEIHKDYDKLREELMLCPFYSKGEIN